MGKRRRAAKITGDDGSVIHTDLDLASREAAAVRHLRLRTETRDGLPVEIAALPNLEHLDVSKNSFAAFPGPFAEQVQGSVHSLAAARSCISTLTPELGLFRALRRLDLSWNEFEALPKAIGELVALEVLRIEKTPLQALPDTIGQLQALRSLGLAGCELSRLPPSIGSLSRLERLDVSDNDVERLPESIGELSALKSLLCANNDLERLPDAIAGLEALVTVDLGGNNLQRLPDSIGGATGGAWSQVTDLDLSGNPELDVDAALEVIHRLPNLRRLDLSGHPLRRDDSLPTGLTALVWRQGAQARLPEQLYRLTDLETLDVAFGKLADVSDRLGELVALRRLDVTANAIEELPGAVGALRHLKVLNAGSNHLERVPAELGQASALRRIDLSFNALNSLPPQWSSLTELRRLNLENNRIDDAENLLQVLSNAPQLERVKLVGNPITLDADACRRLRDGHPDCQWIVEPGKALHRLFQQARRQLAVGQTDEARQKLESIAKFEPGTVGEDEVEFAAHRARCDAQSMLETLNEGRR